MRLLILILLLGTIGRCHGATFDLDTIDNWQIYNGTAFVLSGHDSSLGTTFQGIIKTTDVKELIIQFNHCVGYNDFDVILEIADDNGKNMLTKNFKISSVIRMTIEKEELEPLTPKSLTIRYREKRQNGTDRILGTIRLI